MSDEKQQIDMHGDDLGYSLIERYQDTPVRVYIQTGAVLKGVVTEIRGRFFTLKDGNLEALVNLDFVASVTRA
jgi:hypothetical protein